MLDKREHVEFALSPSLCVCARAHIYAFLYGVLNVLCGVFFGLVCALSYILTL